MEKMGVLVVVCSKIVTMITTQKFQDSVWKLRKVHPLYMGVSVRYSERDGETSYGARIDPIGEHHKEGTLGLTRYNYVGAVQGDSTGVGSILRLNLLGYMYLFMNMYICKNQKESCQREE